MIYLQLFYSFLKIGFFGFGGGYAMLSLIHHEIVARNSWLTDTELSDIIAVSQITPGPIAINSATYTGYMVTGSVWGSALATFAVCLPSLTIMMLLTRFYVKLSDNCYISGAMAGMQPMVVGMIFAAGLMLLTPGSFIDYKSWIIFGTCFLASLKKVNPIVLIILSGAAGFLLYY